AAGAVAGLEGDAVALRLLHRKVLQVGAALLSEPVHAEADEQHIVGRGVLRVQLEPVALEPLSLERAALDELLLLGAHREAEDRQAAVLLPVLADPTADAEAGLG